VRSKPEQPSARWGRPSAASVGAVSTVILVAFTRFFLQASSGRESWIAFVPDDAFYYLGFGRGFATHGVWTFDDGLSVSSGFHLVQAYLAAASWALFHTLSADAPVYALMWLSALFNVLGILVCARLATRIFGACAGLGIALVFLAKNSLVCGASGMEWSLAVLSLALAAEIAIVSQVSTPRRCASAFAVGLLAVVTRSDSAAWVTVFAISALIVGGLGSTKRLSALVLGSALGLLTVAVHTHAITGSWLQDSVLAKVHWGKQRGFDMPGAFNTLSMVTGMSWLGKGVARGTLIALSLFGLAAVRHTRADLRVALLASSLTLIAALTIDSRNSGGLQYWYTDAAVVPCVLLWSAVFAYAQQRFGLHAQRVASITVAVCCVANLWWVREGVWRNQVAMLHAALRLKDSTWSACRVGAWNSGIIGYYRGHDVVNLDGLANHEALLASESGQLAAYLAKAKVSYLVDFEAMIVREEFRARGGYDGPEKQLLLTEVERASASDPRWVASSIVYWRNERLNAPGGDCRKAP
jgi:hypothetical protein